MSYSTLDMIRVNLEDADLIPVRAHATDAGADLKAKKDAWLPKGKRILVKTGVRVEIPAGYVGLLFPRSSLSKFDIIMTNSVGVIDSDYRGEIMASLMYIGDDEGKWIMKDDRIVQLVIIPIILAKFYPVEELSDTTRGSGGFGSTG